jgi:eukaryotic-like serine/threonine-protein kinase
MELLATPIEDTKKRAPVTGSKVGKYEVQRVLGSGTTSTVYLARDPATAREVAVKLFCIDPAGDPEQATLIRKFFLSEVLLAQRLRHPNIVQIYDSAVDDTKAYVAMEYVHGSTLDKYCQRSSLLDFKRVAEILQTVCVALDYAQQHGVIHRDIKPDNILLTENLEPKVSDFGSALNLENAKVSQVEGVGSPAYMSPEQIQGEKLSSHSDMFSLGMVLYKMLTGTLPFTASTHYGIVEQILRANPQAPSARRPGVPEPLDAVFSRATAKDPKQRFGSWREFAEAFAPFSGRPVSSSEMTNETDKLQALKGLSFFAGFEEDDLVEVLKFSTWQRHPAETVLIAEQQANHGFYVLVRGQARVVKNGTLLRVVDPGHCLGETAFLSRNKVKSALTISAVTDITVAKVDPIQLARASDKCVRRFSDAFLAAIADRLIAADTRLSELQVERNITLF